MPHPEATEQVFERRSYRVPARHIARLRFWVEGYDGLLFLRTVEPRGALVEFSWCAASSADAEAVLAALGAEFALEAVANH